jgi:hypothetical protein
MGARGCKGLAHFKTECLRPCPRPSLPVPAMDATCGSQSPMQRRAGPALPPLHRAASLQLAVPRCATPRPSTHLVRAQALAEQLVGLLGGRLGLAAAALQHLRAGLVQLALARRRQPQVARPRLGMRLQVGARRGRGRVRPGTTQATPLLTGHAAKWQCRTGGVSRDAEAPWGAKHEGSAPGLKPLLRVPWGSSCSIDASQPPLLAGRCKHHTSTTAAGDAKGCLPTLFEVCCGT